MYVGSPWRRAGLFALGLLPFALFVVLLPGDSPLPAPSPSRSAESVEDAVALGFPFVDTTPGEPPTTVLRTTSSRPSTQASPRPAPSSVTTTRPAATIPRANPFGPPIPACSNGVDDDGDGEMDMGDAGCSSGADHAEGDNPACSDRLDDDGDGAVDGGDPGCSGPRDRSESDDNVKPPRRGTEDDADFDAVNGAGDDFPMEGLPP